MRRFLPLARSLALRYRRQTESLDDLVQVASVGLVKSIDGFDPSLGLPFKAYAVPTILGELRRHFRDHVWNLRLPRGLQELTMKVQRASDGLAEELGRSPTPTEIAKRLDVTVEDVLDAIEAGHARSTRCRRPDFAGRGVADLGRDARPNGRGLRPGRGRGGGRPGRARRPRVASAAPAVRRLNAPTRDRE